MAGVPETPMHVPPIQRAAGSMTSGPTGLKIDWFETQPSPGFERLAPASRRRESKMLFHQRNKKVVAAMTQNRPLHDIPLRLQPQLSSSVARQLAASPSSFLVELSRQVSQHGVAGFFSLSERFKGRAANPDGARFLTI